MNDLLQNMKKKIIIHIGKSLSNHFQPFILYLQREHASLISPKDAHWNIKKNIANSRRDYEEEDDDDDGPSERVKSTFQDQDS